MTTDWAAILRDIPLPTITHHRWLPGDDLRTRPPEFWAHLIHDHVGGDW